MSTERQESKLIRNLGFWDLMAIAVGQIVGAGIMSSTGVAIGMTGTGVVLAFLLSPFLTIICIFPVAILSSAVPTTGGPYRYCSRLMGKSTGMVYLLLHVTSYSVAVSQYALSFGAYLASIVPSINQHVAAMIILTLFYAMNLVGTKSAAVLNKVMSIALFGGLALFIIFGLPKVNLEYVFNAQNLLFNGPMMFVSTLALLSSATAGAQFTLAKTPCGQYVQGVKQELSEKQKKRLLSSTSIHEVHTLLKTAFSYAVEWDLIHKIPLPRDAPKVNAEERTIWDEKTMLAALQTIENPALHLAVHMSMILSLRESEILGLQPSDLDFDAADGRGTIAVNKIMQRANKDALEKLDPNQVYHTFPDRREGSKSSLILKKPKTKKSNRILYMTKPLKEELQAWLEKIGQDEQNAPEKYSNCGQLFRLSDGLPIAPELLTKWYRLWRAEHPEFEQIVFHGLRHSSATYQLLQSDGDFKSVQGNTGHATAAILMDTYAHTQDKPRLELTEKIEANFYSQDLTPAAPQPQQNEKPVATKITGREILEAIRLMDADERRELTRALFA